MRRFPRLLALERLNQPLASRSEFAGRLLRSSIFGCTLMALTLLIGMYGYHVLEAQDWLDAFLNASMIMSGMGVLTPPVSAGGKLFAGSYALFCGLVLVVATAIVFTPVVHRFLHRLHVDDDAA